MASITNQTNLLTKSKEETFRHSSTKASRKTAECYYNISTRLNTPVFTQTPYMSTCLSQSASPKSAIKACTCSHSFSLNKFPNFSYTLEMKKERTANQIRIDIDT